MSETHTLASPGTVYLVGAGPGDAGLLTLRAKELLEQANVVVYDALVSPGVLALIPPTTEQIYVGKRRGWHTLNQADITQGLVALAQRYPRVVRLKGGDPFIFGRGAEELEGLRAAGLRVEVVPGVSAGIAAPATLGIPLTHRHLSSSVAFVTGHEAIDKARPAVDWAALAQGVDTLVIYMGMHNLATLVTELRQAGRPATTPIALIQWGTWPQQQHLIATLDTVVEKVADHGLGPPAIAIVGAVVNWERERENET